ncbi:MAG TPA: isoprenylcysteine carboxylmethyltransferase family protein [Rhodopila sp.]|uniref:methyltransferase family protein n=1 Tax=Rhodopila sp. TaxID=2480087 RepID=UPI002B5F7F1E|nr:isoprenylcysteine carboxylmethyltransferase family protein [Rhodopila sp.]HVY14411.1 isoprenylcysteine carboxylmethyltransferase family protein [Rhodopila sp.]
MSLPKRLAMIVVGTVVWFGLAVWAGGGVRVFFAHVPLIGLAASQAALSLAAAFAGGNISSGVKEDRRNRWVLPVFFLHGVLLAIVPPWTDRLDVWSFGGDAVRWIGVALFLIGGALRLWPVHALGHRFSGLVAIQPGHELLTTGIYSVIRHPSYLGLLVNAVGWSLAFRSTAGLVLTALIVPVLMARIAAEERLLKQQFGAPYDAWRERTSRLIPGVW